MQNDFEDNLHGDPSGENYKRVIQEHAQHQLITLAARRAFSDALDPNPGEAEEVPSTEVDVELELRRKRYRELQQALLQNYEEIRRRGLSEDEAANGLLDNIMSMPELQEYLSVEALDIQNEVMENNVGQELMYLRQTFPDVYESLNDEELLTLRASLCIEKSYREEMGHPSLLDDWKQKLSDPENKRQARNAGLKYGGYAMTAIALATTFPVGTPGIIAAQLFSRNQDKITQAASQVSNFALRTLTDHGIISPQTVNNAKERLKAIDDITKANRFLKVGRKLTGIGLTFLVAGSVGLYSESLDFGGDASPSDKEAFTPQEPSEEGAEPTAATLESSGEGEPSHTQEQEAESSSIAPIAEYDETKPSTANTVNSEGIAFDSAGLTRDAGLFSGSESSEIESHPDSLQNGHEGTTQNADAAPSAYEDVTVHISQGDTLSEILHRELMERGVSASSEVLYGNETSPGVIDMVTNANANINDANLIFEGDTFTIPSAVFEFADGTSQPPPSIENSASTTADDIGETLDKDQLNMENPASSAAGTEEFTATAIPDENAPTSLNTESHSEVKHPSENSLSESAQSSPILEASSVEDVVTSLPPDQRYEATALLRDLAIDNNLSFMNTPPDILFSRLPLSAQEELVGLINSFYTPTEDLSSATTTQPSELTTEASQNVEVSPSPPEMANAGVTGWIGHQASEFFAKAKGFLGIGGGSELSSPATLETSNGIDDATNSSLHVAGAPVHKENDRDQLKKAANEISSAPNYQQPSYPDVLNEQSTHEKADAEAINGDNTQRSASPPPRKNSGLSL